MLDTITKRRIDDCRDILVGKLPDPKSQIEQITIALIYKFMDDMDKEAIELGGKAKFFTDYTIPEPNNPNKEITIPFEKYSWDNLFDPKVSATDMLKLYMEAIEGMVKNPNIPELFANIFKNAYLPYRDPETLKMFLKTIGEFEYTHSEKLGDAFEYLLSVMGSQGDAGQFRTPRHIIDFLVAAVDPKKTDTILDPACGTAGFLISAFKYITDNGNGNRRDAMHGVSTKNNLTPDEQKRIIKNFIGYDISPDMVRLSLVNLYLHGFTDPHIYEYDTLSSEERWDETFDVVLANPPFMSPKGGIRPHKKFSISSNRSEVLFVDYIAEHLNPKGRAGIIVPEGIIFQSGTAYKDLRKMLVNKYLYAVVSLPAGVFNPYSGVKTSILLMDADLAKKTKDVLFVKIDNDGYGLGSQRNAVKGGQLEEAITTLKTFRENCIEGKPFENTSLAQAVSKTEIGKSGDFNLSGLRYNKNITDYASDFKKIPLSELCDLQSGYAFDSNLFNETEGFPLIRIRDIKTNKTKTKYTGQFKEELIVKNGDLIIGMDGEFNTCIWKGNDALLNQRVCRLINYKNVSKDYVFRMIQKKLKEIEDSTFAVTVKHISGKQILNIEIPLPPLAVQEEIVAEIESYQKIIDGAKMVVDNYKPRIVIDKDWEMEQLDKIIKLSSGRGLTSSNMIEGQHPVYGGNGINGYHNEYFLEEPTIVIGRVGAYCGVIHVTEKKSWISDNGLYVTNFLQEIELEYLSQILTQLNLNQFAKVGGQPSISQKTVTDLKIPIPSIDIQKRIVSQIQKEKTLVNANKELIAIYEQKIKDRIGKVWGT
jgi:type I restriction enzyme M protein